MTHWVLATILVTGAATAAADSSDPALPDELVRIAALPDGGALALGGTHTDRGPWPYRLVHVDAAGAATPEVLPPIGDPLDLAVLGDRAFVLGTTGVATRTGNAGWQAIPLAPRELDLERGGRIVALDADHALAVRIAISDAHDTSVIAAIDARDGRATPVAELADVVLAPGVADGAGGAWLVAKRPAGKPHEGRIVDDSPTGYVHQARGAWTFWQIERGYGDELARPAFAVKAAPQRVYSEREVVGDGRGGWFGATYGWLVHVRADGTGAALTADKLPAGSLDAIGWDPAHEHVLALIVPYFGEGERTPILVTLDRDGRIVSRERLELPSWYREVRFPPVLWHGTISAAGDTTWIAIGPFVLARHAAGAWVVRNSVQPMREARRRDADDRHAARVGTAAVVAALAGGAAVGGGGGAALRGDRRAGFEMVGGMLGAVPTAALLDHALSARAEAHPGPGLPQIAWALHDLACGIGVIGLTSVTAASTYEAGVMFDSPASRDGALGGAFAGAAIGTITSGVLTKYLQRRWPDRPGLRTSIAASVISSAATFGYQLGGGGR
ncbi:MAG: hypothetical protein ACM31C_25855 [Acidobacteriota bacterium]